MFISISLQYGYVLLLYSKNMKNKRGRVKNFVKIPIFWNCLRILWFFMVLLLHYIEIRRILLLYVLWVKCQRTIFSHFFDIFFWKQGDKYIDSVPYFSYFSKKLFSLIDWLNHLIESFIVGALKHEAFISELDS